MFGFYDIQYYLFERQLQIDIIALHILDYHSAAQQLLTGSPRLLVPLHLFHPHDAAKLFPLTKAALTLPQQQLGLAQQLRRITPCPPPVPRHQTERVLPIRNRSALILALEQPSQNEE
jgi:hypothetical protein